MIAAVLPSSRRFVGGFGGSDPRARDEGDSARLQLEAADWGCPYSYDYTLTHPRQRWHGFHLNPKGKTKRHR